jgi:hypothetical protein
MSMRFIEKPDDVDTVPAATTNAGSDSAVIKVGERNEAIGAVTAPGRFSKALTTMS